jgi:hypothetical protein
MLISQWNYDDTLLKTTGTTMASRKIHLNNLGSRKLHVMDTWKLNG